MGTDMTVSWLHIVSDYGASSNHLSLTCDAQCAASTTTKATTTLDDDDDDDDDDDGDGGILSTSQRNGWSSNQPFLTLYRIEGSLLCLQEPSADPHYNFQHASTKRLVCEWSHNIEPNQIKSNQRINGRPKLLRSYASSLTACSCIQNFI
jgi:hypothetical protein